MSSNCCHESVRHYRVVNSIFERNTIPCEERINGMLVTVTGLDNSYKQYILKGGDPCVNTNWKEFGLSYPNIEKAVGHETIPSLESQYLPVTSSYLNSRYPESKEGFRVTVSNLNTTFMKVYGDVWVMTNNVPINYE